MFDAALDETFAFFSKAANLGLIIRPPFPGFFLSYPSRRQHPAALTALIGTLRLKNVCLGNPTYGRLLRDEHFSLSVSVVLIAVYVANLIYPPVTHRDVFSFAHSEE